VILGESQSALPVQVFTTAGFLKPGIFGRGTEVKIIFRSSRIGFSTDYFAVPLSDLPDELRDKNGLEATELDWQSLELREPAATEEHRAAFPAALEAVRAFRTNIPGSPRARRDLLHWDRRILIRTGGGDLGLVLADQTITAVEVAELGEPELTPVIDDPNPLAAWTTGESIVNDPHRPGWDQQPPGHGDDLQTRPPPALDPTRPRATRTAVAILAAWHRETCRDTTSRVSRKPVPRRLVSLETAGSPRCGPGSSARYSRSSSIWIRRTSLRLGGTRALVQAPLSRSD